MHLMSPRTLGIIVMVLFGLLGAFMFLSPGSFRLNKPEGGNTAWAYNVLNLLLMLAVTPVVAVVLMRDQLALLGATRVPLPQGGSWLAACEGVGLGLVALANAILYWSRLALGRSFRLGAVRPRDEDRLVEGGPYRWVRHPMYTAVLSLALGLAVLVQSWLLLALFVALLALIVRMIPAEEQQLRDSYGSDYERYSRRSKRLLPLLY